MSILAEIVERKKVELEAAKAAVPLDELRAQLADAPPVRSFFDALTGTERIQVIAEVKRQSPSAGQIRADFDPVAIATAYAANGAACISVLTDESYFGGHLDYLRAIRAAVEIPLLRKEFVIDEYQVIEARSAGADAVLLIAECLDDCRLRGLHNQIIDLGMTPLVEFHDRENCQRVVDAGADLIGVNNRNLHTFETDLEHTVAMRSLIPGDRSVVSESGIRCRDDLLWLEDKGVAAVLVGESLMRKPDVGAAIRELMGR
ncbi:MAG: indole-3-glycerol phosphate synthase TrpC [Planctomycetota bacterium]